MTVSGDNDTSVAYGAVGGVPGDGEIPMETVRSCPSAESPMKIMSGVLDKYGQTHETTNKIRAAVCGLFTFHTAALLIKGGIP